MPVPKFDDLPMNDVVGLREAWNVFGPQDNLGSVNFLTRERVASACGLVRRGEVVNLCIPLSALDPPPFGRAPMRHEIFSTGRNNLDDRLDNFFLQCASHWDGLRHVQARQAGFWGGRPRDDAMMSPLGPLGIEHWVRHGLVGRGVLLDVAKTLARTTADYDPNMERSVGTEDLEATAADEGVEIQAGDILCVRFGWMAKALARGDQTARAGQSTAEFAGLAADEAMSRWLWDHNVAAVACDNPAVEVAPGDAAVGSLHRRLIPMLGIALGELFDFEDLAAACARSGRWEFLFVSVPLYLPGGVGSPANAIAIL